MHFTITSQTEKVVVNSTALNQKVEAYIFETAAKGKAKPTVFITDGRKFMNGGALDKIKTLAASQKIPPVNIVFVSTINPENGTDNRNTYFACNASYIQFFEKELIPEVEACLNIKQGPKDRSLVGFSYGGLNTAFFTAQSDQFMNYGILSPYTRICPEIKEKIGSTKLKNLKIFLSTGTGDAESNVEVFNTIYTAQKHNVNKVQTTGGHTFSNWIGQLEAIINYHFN